jgi:hypothetical protein
MFKCSILKNTNKQTGILKKAIKQTGIIVFFLTPSQGQFCYWTVDWTCAKVFASYFNLWADTVRSQLQQPDICTQVVQHLRVHVGFCSSSFLSTPGAGLISNLTIEVLIMGNARGTSRVHLEWQRRVFSCAIDDAIFIFLVRKYIPGIGDFLGCGFKFRTVDAWKGVVDLDCFALGHWW